MAKLGARGRTELLRVSKEREVVKSDLINWEKVTIAFMSDGTVLEKRDVRFLPDTFDPKGRRHSYGWKRKGKLKEGANLQEAIQRAREKYQNAGWVVETIT